MKNVWPLQRDALTFYGNPYKAGFEDKNIITVHCPWMFTKGNNNIRSHKKCADSLLRVLNATWEKLGKDQEHVKALGYDVFDGSFVVRPMRGGTAMSMHSVGAAFDFNAAKNMQHAMKHLFQHNTPLVDFFIAEGWVWGGDWSPASIDAMHFQAARVHA